MRLILFVLSTTLPFISCTPKLPHKDAVNYFVTISKVMNIDDEKQKQFQREFSSALTLAKQNSADKYYNIIIDSLQIHFKAISSIYDSKLKDASEINSIGPDMNLKKDAIILLEKMKKLHSLSGILVFELIPHKFSDITNQQKTALKEFEDFAKQFNEENHAGGGLSNFQEKLLDFQHKYNISDSELKSYGL